MVRPVDSLRTRSKTSSRPQQLTPQLAKGLEFDLVVLLDPEEFGTEIESTLDRYVAMTRMTQQMVLLSS